MRRLLADESEVEKAILSDLRYARDEALPQMLGLPRVIVPRLAADETEADPLPGQRGTGTETNANGAPPIG